MPVQENQVGSIFAINAIATGIECFDSAATHARIHPKIVRSFALDALEKKGQEAVCMSLEAANALLADICAASMEDFDALGKGRDVRATAKDINGGVLVEAERVIHLCIFRIQDDSSENQETSSRWVQGCAR